MIVVDTLLDTLHSGSLNVEASKLNFQLVVGKYTGGEEREHDSLLSKGA
jgi:hypothetical protein